MSETNIDHLLQVTAPRSDWTAASSARGREQSPGFDDHLHQASAPQPSEPTRRDYDKRREQNPTHNVPPTKPAAQMAGHNPSANDDNSSDIANASIDSPPDATPLTGNEDAAADDTVRSDATAKDAKETGAAEQTDESGTVDANELSAAAAMIGDIAVDFDEAEGQAADQDVSVADSENPADGNRSDESGGEGTPADIKRRLAGAQLIAPIGDPATFNYVLDAEALPSPEHGGADSRAADAQTGKILEITKRHRPTTAVRERTNGRQEAEASDLGAQENAQVEKSTAGTTNKQPAANEVQLSPDEARGKSNSRDVAISPEARTELSAASAKIAEATAAASSTSEVATDTPTADAPQDTNRPATPTNSARGDILLQPLVRLQRGASAAARGSRTSEGEELPRVDATRFVGRVARAFHTAQERGGALQLRLSPPELGSMRIELMIKDGVLAASLETETQTARRVLLDHLPALRDRLAEQNIRIEKFDVDVRRDGGGQQQSAPEQHRDGQSPHWTPPRQQPKHAQESAPTAPTLGARTTDTQINLVA